MAGSLIQSKPYSYETSEAEEALEAYSVSVIQDIQVSRLVSFVRVMQVRVLMTARRAITSSRENG